jgi:hypothetical protein
MVPSDEALAAAAETNAKNSALAEGLRQVHYYTTFAMTAD